MHIYERLGVTRVINALATVTRLGGSIMPPEVVEAMREASRHFVDIRELLDKSGEYIADLTNNEAAFVCNSAACGVLLCVAAAISNGDASEAAALPFLAGQKNEIVCNHHKPNGFEPSITCAGARIVEYGGPESATEEMLEAAVTERTAAVFSFHYGLLDSKRGQLPLETQAKIAANHRIPFIIDAAAQIPGRENLWKYTRDIGADAAIFSGGKGLRGPQSSGLIVGKKRFVETVRSIGFPNSGIGRTMKIGKEEIAGLVAAVELCVNADEAGVICGYERDVRRFVQAFDGEDALEVFREYPSEAGQPMPKAVIGCVEGKLMIDSKGLCEALKLNDPVIYAALIDGFVHINPQTLEAGELDIIIKKIKKIVSENRKA